MAVAVIADTDVEAATPLGRALLAIGLLDHADILRAEMMAQASRISLARILPQLGLVSEQQLVEALAAISGLPVLATADFPQAYPVLAGLNGHWLSQMLLLPLAINDGLLQTATADPWQEELIGQLAFATGCDIEIVIARPSDILDNLQRSPYLSSSGASPSRAGATGGNNSTLAMLLEGVSEAPAIRAVQAMLTGALRRGASDIHIEPMARSLSVRFRIDGQLVEVDSLQADQARPIASRIKVLSGLDISETRLPQDGRMQFNHQGDDVDVRVSTSPIAFGESIVLRILGRNKVPLDLDQIGLPKMLRDELVALLERPNGMILMTGPTGSGKTTTLYAALNYLRCPQVKILTVEDPVEILLDGVNQVQVRPDIGLDYANSLRAFLRQDPDILMIGEIRDRETADIALRASLTGHLVLSSLHTNSAIGAFERLIDIGIEPFLAASTVTASIAQRLMRLLCDQCSRSRFLTDEEEALFARWCVPTPSELREPTGCNSCANTGYHGRVPVLELIATTDELRGLIQKGETASYRLPPERQLSGHALHLVAEGKTGLEEAIRVTGVA